jgi:hypothetical protein
VAVKPFAASAVDCVKSMCLPKSADFAENRHPR